MNNPFGQGTLTGFRLAEALETNADECADDSRANLMRGAASELRGLIDENKRLSWALKRVLDCASDSPSANRTVTLMAARSALSTTQEGRAEG